MRTPSTVTGTSSPSATRSSRSAVRPGYPGQRWVRLRRAEAAEDVPAAADAQETVGAVPRQQLGAHLLVLRDRARQDLGRQESLDQVVVAAVPVPSGKTEHAGHEVRLQHGPYRVRRCPEPVDQRSLPALEVQGRQRALRPDAGQDVVGDLRVPAQDLLRSRSQRPAEPRVVAGGDDGEALAVHLDQPAALVEEVIGPRGVVAGDAGVEHEVVVAAGDGERVELDGAETTGHLQHRVGPSRERARGRQHLACDEKTSGVLGRDLHAPRRGRSRSPSSQGTHAGPSRPSTGGARPARPGCRGRRE